MAELKIEIPEELIELKSTPNINWQLVLSRRLKEELEELAKIKRIVSKSKLAKENAKELADEVSFSLAKRYKKLLTGK